MSRGDPATGSLSAVLGLAARLGADVKPRPVQYARVTMSDMPTCNRILPGSGWEIPADDPSLARLLANEPGTKA